MLKIIGIVLLAILGWIIVTKPSAASGFLAGLVNDGGTFLRTVLPAVLELLKDIFAGFQKLQRGG